MSIYFNLFQNVTYLNWYFPCYCFAMFSLEFSNIHVPCMKRFLNVGKILKKRIQNGKT